MIRIRWMGHRRTGPDTNDIILSVVDTQTQLDMNVLLAVLMMFVAMVAELQSGEGELLSWSVGCSAMVLVMVVVCWAAFGGLSKSGGWPEKWRSCRDGDRRFGCRGW
ncbi:putative pollen-specific leucine-rich repeat extensin-like protein 3 [Iris pallida]|uniref:Pollen-specific leucine-rich repeat extensin-like protein 3 n=1 Tax=Iris pallida TaxID=29817 RepID=A0AAX6GZ89_IRIPA|nr:putative pollen-specific leucine-rich repeat extensin-like protein 3 [Iris pallida]